jgi:hypothetical protein
VFTVWKKRDLRAEKACTNQILTFASGITAYSAVSRLRKTTPKLQTFCVVAKTFHKYKTICNGLKNSNAPSINAISSLPCNTTMKQTKREVAVVH